MKPRLSILTLGVSNFERAYRFYHEGLKLPTEGILGEGDEHGAVVFFDLQAGMKLALWPLKSIAADAGLPEGAPSPTALTIGHNVASKEEVNEVLEQARQAGATIVKEAADTFWGGYSGYFQDPDGHLWEVAWNPFFELPE